MVDEKLVEARETISKKRYFYVFSLAAKDAAYCNSDLSELDLLFCISLLTEFTPNSLDFQKLMETVCEAKRRE